MVLNGWDWADASAVLDGLFLKESNDVRIGTSKDTYWIVSDEDAQADFLRVRERDGIRQITVKGKDKKQEGNLNRIEVDVDSSSEVHNIHRLVRCLLGKSAGVIQKTYRVWELESEWDTVCLYELFQPFGGGLYVEVEAKTEERMLELERRVLRSIPDAKRANGSLFEMFINKGVSK